jgi:hypothetical protein
VGEHTDKGFQVVKHRWQAERTCCVFHGFLPPSPSEGCHSVHVNAAT